MDQNNKNPSHIIVNVDKNTSEEDVLAFCTNIKKENAEIRFTYQCYDNQIPGNDTDLFDDLTNSIPDDPENLFIITDSKSVADRTKELGMACAAYFSGAGRSRDLSGILYCIEDIAYISYDRLKKMWERYHNIPWTIATTERMVIREQTLRDIDALYEIYSDKDITKYTEPLYDDPKKEADYLQAYIDNQYRFYEFGIWALTLRQSGKLIGRAGISIREGYDLPELGYVIGKEYQGCGYAKEALDAIMDYAAGELGMSEFMAFTKERNTPSVRLLKSLGFVKTGNALIKGGYHAMYLLTKQ